jgi:putative ABC transport system permease protein
LDQSGIEFKGDGPLRNLTGTRLIVDPDYLRLYHIQLVAGSDFRDDSSSNGHHYIVNETMARELLRDMPGKPITALLGRRFGFDSSGVIVGVAKDFNFNSLHYKIETLFLFNEKDWGYSTVSVKLQAGHTKEGIALIETAWKRLFPGHPLEYEFLDDHFAEVYRTDSQVSKMVGVLAGLAIFISCLGLFGLASYSAEQRVKEIGIRKVMGASIQNIVLLLSRHFIVLVLIANVIAWPLAWFTVNKWLQDYAYRVSISWWVFLMAGGLALVIAMVTVSTLAARAARANPMKSLKTE